MVQLALVVAAAVAFQEADSNLRLDAQQGLLEAPEIGGWPWAKRRKAPSFIQLDTTHGDELRTAHAGKREPGDNVYKKNGGTGGWGGACECPDGTTYWVGDDGNACKSMNFGCQGGKQKKCTRWWGKWSRGKVECGLPLEEISAEVQAAGNAAKLEIAEMGTHAAEDLQNTKATQAAALQSVQDLKETTVGRKEDVIAAKNSSIEDAKNLNYMLAGESGPPVVSVSVTSTNELIAKPSLVESEEAQEVANAMTSAAHSKAGAADMQEELKEKYGLAGMVDLLAKLERVFEADLGSDSKMIKQQIANAKTESNIAYRSAYMDVREMVDDTSGARKWDDEFEREFEGYRTEFEKDYTQALEEIAKSEKDFKEISLEKHQEVKRLYSSNQLNYDSFAGHLKEFEKSYGKDFSKLHKYIERIKDTARKIFAFLETKDHAMFIKMKATLEKQQSDVAFDGALKISDAHRQDSRALAKFDRHLEDAEKKALVMEDDLKTHLGVMMHRLMTDIEHLIEETKDRIQTIQERNLLYSQQGRVTMSQVKDKEASLSLEVRSGFEPFASKIRDIARNFDYNINDAFDRAMLHAKTIQQNLRDNVNKDLKHLQGTANAAALKWKDDLSSENIRQKKMLSTTQENQHLTQDLGLQIENADLAYRASKDQLLTHVQSSTRETSRFAGRVNVAMRALAKMTYDNWDRITGVSGHDGMKEWAPIQIHKLYEATMAQIDQESEKLKAQVKEAIASHDHFKEDLEPEIYRLNTAGATDPGSPTMYEQIYEFLAKDDPELKKTAQRFAQWAQNYVNTLSVQEYAIRGAIAQQRRKESARFKAGIKRQASQLANEEKNNIKDEFRAKGEDLKRLERSVNEEDALGESRGDIFERNMNELAGIMHGLNLRVKDLGNALEPGKEAMWQASDVISDESLHAQNASFARALTKANTEISKDLRHKSRQAKEDVVHFLEREQEKISKDRQIGIAQGEGHLAETINSNREMTAHVSNKVDDVKDTLGDMDRATEHAIEVLLTASSRSRADAEEMSRTATKHKARAGRTLGALADDARERLQKVLEDAVGQLTSVDAKSDLAKKDLVALQRAYEAQDLDAVKALVSKMNARLAREARAVQNEGKKSTRELEAAKRGMAGVEERWKDAESRNEAKNDGVAAKLRQFDGTDQGIKQRGNRAESHGERLTASLNMIGSDVSDISKHATDSLTVEGSKFEADARIAGIGVESSIERAQSLQELALHGQQERDEQLAQAVGGFLALIHGTNEAAARGRNQTQLAEDAVKQLVQVETDTIRENAAVLNKFQGETTFKVLQLLGPLVKRMVEQDHQAAAGYAKAAAGFHQQEVEADHILGSDAIQTLQKMQHGEDLAAHSLYDAEELLDWMKRYHDDSEIFRPEVEKILKEADDSIQFHGAEVKADQLESSNQLKASQGSMLKGIENMLNGMGSADGTSSVKDMLKSNVEAFKNSQVASAKNDAERLKLLLKQAAETSPETAKTIANALKDQSIANDVAAEGKVKMADMVQMLKELTEHQEAAVGKERNLLSSKLEAFQNTLFGFTGEDPSAALTIAAGAASNVSTVVEPIGRPLSDGDRKHFAGKTALAQKLDKLLELLEEVPKKTKEAEGSQQRQLAASVLQQLVKQAKDLHDDHERLSARHEAVGGVIKNMLTKVVSGLF